MYVFSFLKYMVKEEHNALEEIFDDLDNSMLNHPLSKNKDEADSVGSRLAHIIEAEYRMATYLYQDPNDEESFKVDKSSLDDIREKSLKSQERHLLTLNNLSTDDLEKIWISKVSGNSYSYKFLLWHFIEHIATHRGQVAMVINRFE